MNDPDVGRNEEREPITRRSFVLGAAGGVAALASGAAPFSLVGTRPRSAPSGAAADGAAEDAAAATFELEETTIAQLQDGMRSGRYTARSIAELYLARIDALDHKGPRLSQVLQVNPEALDIADQLDHERKEKGPRGPMHGIPVLLKDNIATADRLESAAGSLALVGSRPPRDAFLVERLRAAGAVILGKTNLSEWANFRSRHSSSGWSGRGGQGFNPYALDRSPSGSSSGSGAAASANFSAVCVGTETDGSVTSPAASNSIVGIKPTLGLISRAGIVPISHSQDTAGPMARTVTDAAILLGAMAGVDTRDAATSASRGHALTDYTQSLKRGALRGARIGVARKRYTGYSPKADAVFETALKALKDAGAILVDPADIETAGQWGRSEFQVLLYEFKADLDRYLAGLASSRVRSLADVIAFNDAHHAQEMPFFGQDIMIAAQKKGPLTEQAYLDALAKDHRLTRTEGIDKVMDAHNLDALVAPTHGPPWLIDLVNGDTGAGGAFTSPAAVAGYPHITVPAGYTFGLPVGLSFVGRAWSEAKLLALAFDFEQATKARRPPTFRASADLSEAPGLNG